ncbi:hypothetical protein [Streptomyces sp. KM273126]|nr:hypothetical protein [Streptomyces sp. KM273126]
MAGHPDRPVCRVHAAEAAAAGVMACVTVSGSAGTAAPRRTTR